MSGNVWHKRFHGDALNGYMGLTLEQRGAYTTLLDLMYDSGWEPGIPDRERWIAGHLNVSVRRWQKLREDLLAAGKIDLVDGAISNSRYRKERENALEISRKRAENGSSGGRKSRGNAGLSNEINGGGQAIASDLPLYARASEAEADKIREEEIDKESATAIPNSRADARPDLHNLAARCGRAAGVAVFPNRVRHFADQITVVGEWVAMGLDPDTEMIPALEQRVLDDPRERHSLAYFTPLMADIAARKDAAANGRRPSSRDRRSRTGYGSTVDAAAEWIAEGD